MILAFKNYWDGCPAYASSLCTYPAYAAYVFQVMVLAAALVTKPHACALMSNHYYVALRVRIDLA